MFLCYFDENSRTSRALTDVPGSSSSRVGLQSGSRAPPQRGSDRRRYAEGGSPSVGGLTHGGNLYHETVRVPLLLYLPGENAQPGRVSSHVTTLDVVPTLRGLLGLPASDQDQGKDLLAEGARPPVLGLLAGKSGQHSLEGDLRSIVMGDHRLIALEGGTVELYDIKADPLERIDLAEEFPEIVTELLQELDRVERSAPVYPHTTRMPTPPTEAMLEHLRGIGYLGDD